jgi:diaminopimelate epimerase
MNPLQPERRRLRLTKHHGAGNDFLVLLDLEDAFPVDAETARALCHRRYGIGADGVIRGRSGAGWADLGMELRNADGSPAEMSGNGIRCLAQAAVEAGLVVPPTFTVSTAGGIRTVDFRPGACPGTATASVDMGEVALGEDQPQQFDGRKARTVRVGNPHLVLFGPDPAAVDVAELGTRLQEVHPGGINVEFISLGPAADSLDLRVWERGVGETEACGTGSVAAAAAARSWGLVGDTVEVRNPGGTLEVALGGGQARLSGPVHMVAKLKVDIAALLEAPRP